MTKVVIISSEKDKKEFLENFLVFWLIKEKIKIEIYDKTDEIDLNEDDILLILQDDKIDNFIEKTSRLNYTILLNFYYNETKYNLNNFCNIDIHCLHHKMYLIIYFLLNFYHVM